MQNASPQDQALESVFDLVVPGIGKRFGDCTGEDLGIVARKLRAAGRGTPPEEISELLEFSDRMDKMLGRQP